MNFKNLNLIDPIIRAITEGGYSKPTEIQHSAIPHVLDGKDIIACAQTGTGKTAAFAIPILQLLKNNKKEHRNVRALILTPTRELAIQIETNFKQYSKYLNLSQLSIFGGVKPQQQITALKKRTDTLIATPGRLLDLIGQGLVDLSKIEIFVLDEADRMLDMGFVNDVKKIIKLLPKVRQTLFFSATMPEETRKFANTILKQPVEVKVSPVSSTAKTVQQSVYFVEKRDKTQLLINLLKEQPLKRSLIFTRTKHGADKLVKKLRLSGLKAAAIHGNKSQNARQQTLEDFKQERTLILIATDIASRGIDISELSHVINYEIPNIPETYVHRIGRTGRAGTEGRAVSFCDREERVHLKNIQKLTGSTIVEVKYNQSLN